MSRNPQGEPRTEAGRAFSRWLTDATLEDIEWRDIASDIADIEAEAAAPQPPDFSACCGQYLPTGECCAAVYGTANLTPLEPRDNREAEAAAPVEGLDVERLARALIDLSDSDEAKGFILVKPHLAARLISREYAALRAIESPAHPETAE